MIYGNQPELGSPPSERLIYKVIRRSDATGPSVQTVQTQSDVQTAAEG
jgi:hypothetical protein